METHELVESLKKMSERSHKKFDNSIGKRGGKSPASDFYMGAYAAIDNIIFAIENDDKKTIDTWAK